jgi:hypothetical protein
VKHRSFYEQDQAEMWYDLRTGLMYACVLGMLNFIGIGILLIKAFG